VLEDRLTGSRIVRVRVRQADGDLDELLYEHQDDPSEPVRTTLDLDVQTAIENALRSTDGSVAVVAVDPATGGVLGSASRPLDGFNRAFEGRYPPGSTFKVVTTTALLAAGVVEPETTVACPAETIVGGLRVRNAGGLDLGEVPFSTAFARSCNTSFAAAAEQLSDDDLARAASAFGFATEGEEPALELALPAFGGSFPAPADLAERAAASFGQARVEASALELAAVSAAVLDGTWRTPRLLADVEPGDSRPLPAGSALVLRELMELTVAEGSGASAAVDGLTVGGKTGSAEFGDGDPKPSHAWFIGYATGGEGVAGRIAFAVLVEGGGSGGDVAAPIAGRFLDELQVLAARRAAEAADGGDG
jgi:cell division protein FtsI/penicillin-binding protein 2